MNYQMHMKVCLHYFFIIIYYINKIIFYSFQFIGFLNNREGHNFPSEYIPNNKKHVLYKYKFQCKYVIGVYKSNSLAHEMCHAKYYIDEDYKNKIDKEWEALTPATRDYLIAFLKRLGYSDKVLIDEYQAYRYTEADNFFGIKFK